jgi:hypothetical protein
MGYVSLEGGVEERSSPTHAIDVVTKTASPGTLMLAMADQLQFNRQRAEFKL